MNITGGTQKENQWTICIRDLDKEIESVRSGMENLHTRIEKFMNPAPPPKVEKGTPDGSPSGIQEIRTLTDKVSTIKEHINEILNRLEV